MLHVIRVNAFTARVRACRQSFAGPITRCAEPLPWAARAISRLGSSSPPFRGQRRFRLASLSALLRTPSLQQHSTHTVCSRHCTLPLPCKYPPLRSLLFVPHFPSILTSPRASQSYCSADTSNFIAVNKRSEQRGVLCVESLDHHGLSTINHSLVAQFPTPSS